MSKTSELAAGGPATFGMRLLIASLAVLFLAGAMLFKVKLGPDPWSLGALVLLLSGSLIYNTLNAILAQHLRQFPGELPGGGGADHTAQGGKRVAATGVRRLLFPRALFGQQGPRHKQY